MKAWDIVGWVYDGAAYCAEHKPEPRENVHGGWDFEEVSPVFASDEQDHSCDACGEPLE